ncbi:MAG: glycosyltransferase family 8 protein [Cetobacterium sp.]
MNIVLLINEKNDYGRHLGATLLSVLENSNMKWNIYVVYLNLSEKSKQNIEKIVKKYKSKLKFIKLDPKELERFIIDQDGYLDLIVFGRLYIPKILSEEKKALYLDCDIIVQKPLEELYQKDLNGYSILAVPDGKKDQKLSKKRLGMKEEKKYFNAGVMLMDLEELRKNNFFEETIKYCLNPDKELELNEQDALNIIFENNFKSEEIVWNYTHGHNEENDKNLAEIGIIHFTGSSKPWHCKNYSQYKKIYWKYLNMTPWKGYKEEDRSLKNILKREMTILKLKTRKLRYRLKGKKYE